MSSQDARHFGKSLFHKLTDNQAQTEDLFEQIYLNNVHNIESRISDEEAQQRMSSEIINYTTSISGHFTSPKEREMAQGIIPYIMLEYASSSNVEPAGKSSFDEEKQQEQPNQSKPHTDFSQKFRENLERLKPYILEKYNQTLEACRGSSNDRRINICSYEIYAWLHCKTSSAYGRRPWSSCIYWMGGV